MDAGLARLGIRLTDDARTTIDGHVRLLLAWNQAINLTAIRDPAEIAVRHVIDSLTGLAVLRDHKIDRFIDLGSGGGFPGIALAATLPADRALLVDSIGKKVRFLTTAIDALGLAEHAAAEAIRAEALAAGRDRGRWPAVVARAVASLADLVEIGLPLLAPGGILVAWKRDNAADRAALTGELADARRVLAEVDGSARMDVRAALPVAGGPATVAAGPSTLAGLAAIADHVLVVVTRGPGVVAATWPRDPAARRRAR